MGMFDYITCEMPLPDGKPGAGFQTKCLDCDLSKYTITKFGWLVKLNPDFERIVEEFTGMVTFYDYVDEKTWREYTALVVGGRVKEILLSPRDSGFYVKRMGSCRHQ